MCEIYERGKAAVADELELFLAPWLVLEWPDAARPFALIPAATVVAEQRSCSVVFDEGWERLEVEVVSFFLNVPGQMRSLQVPFGFYLEQWTPQSSEHGHLTHVRGMSCMGSYATVPLFSLIQLCSFSS